MSKSPSYLSLALLIVVPPIYYLYRGELYEVTRKYFNIEEKKKKDIYINDLKNDKTSEK